jgi:hypothetical protein
MRRDIRFALLTVTKISKKPQDEEWEGAGQ